MNDLMNGYVLNGKGEMTLSRKEKYGKNNVGSKKLQKKQEAESKSQAEGKPEDSKHIMVKRVDGCGANQRTGEAAEFRNIYSRPKKERDKAELLNAEKMFSSDEKEVELNFESDITEDTRINRRKSKISLPASIGKELLQALTITKKKLEC
ncbi:hypothetical protein O0Q50_19035 [Priestia aryabhattai]|uniref:Uncharacterized protein n=1 Tax=Priestia aryabhattai TaxID=412384 RepID=A0AAX6NBJ8_PRIAR|nr:hypothetical protein [Priestia aryabhattai]MDU9693268.1 hypothetical protein [Priestia aryabhattai]